MLNQLLGQNRRERLLSFVRQHQQIETIFGQCSSGAAFTSRRVDIQAPEVERTEPTSSSPRLQVSREPLVEPVWETFGLLIVGQSGCMEPVLQFVKTSQILFVSDFVSFSDFPDF